MFDLIDLTTLVVILPFEGLDLAERLMFVEELRGAPVLEWEGSGLEREDHLRLAFILLSWRSLGIMCCLLLLFIARCRLSS